MTTRRIMEVGKIYKRSRNKRIDQKGKAKHGVIENKNNIPSVVDWSNARNTRPYIFDSYEFVNDSPDKPTLEYEHSFTLHGRRQDEVEIALIQQKDSWKSNEKALAFFVCETENGPLLCASIPTHISKNDQSGPKSNSKAFGSRSTSPPKNK